MKLARLIILYTILFLSLVLSSCKKHDTDLTNQPPLNSGITELLCTTGFYTQKLTFLYPPDNRSYKIVDTFWQTNDPIQKFPSVSYDILLNEQRRPVKIIASRTFQDTFYRTTSFIQTANHALIRRFEDIDPNYPPVENWLGFNTKGRVNADTTYYTINNQIPGFKRFTYDDNDNIIKEEQYENDGLGTFTLTYTNEYTYDQKANPFYGLDGRQFFWDVTPYFPHFGKNNLLTETFVSAYTGARQRYGSYNYKYNDKGLPIERTYISLTGIPGVTHVEYRYKE